MNEQILLTPGPLTTSVATRQAMNRDWGSRDPAFIELTAELRQRLLATAHGTDTHVCVPLQGAGTFIVEAAIATLMGRDDKLLVLANGAYGERMVKIAQRLGRSVRVMRWPENEPVDSVQVETALGEDASITHVALVHCETTTGLLNPLDRIAAVVAGAGRSFILDAMSSFGALEIDLRATPVTAVLASSNKCLEGVPGLSFALIARDTLTAAKGNSASVSLDLHEQWCGFEKDGQWRFTPPVQVVAALVEALRQLEEEGGPQARFGRYRNNYNVLSYGMRRLGFELYLDDALQAPIIATFQMSSAIGISFAALYDALATQGFLIYPGKLTYAETFRVGCIGALDSHDFDRFIGAVEVALAPVSGGR